jgi:hypothetical protein
VSDSTNDKENPAAPNDDTLDIYSLPIGKLRRVATTVYNVSLTRDMTRDDILKAIEKITSRKSFAPVVDPDKLKKSSGPPPGRARITLLANTYPGATNRPHPVKVNGSICWVPRGHMCDLPIKHFEVLNNAVQTVMTHDSLKAERNPMDKEQYAWQDQHVHPFILHGITEGPDPYPGDERTRGAKALPYRLFQEKFDFYPSREELKQAMANGDLPEAGLGNRKRTVK